MAAGVLILLGLGAVTVPAEAAPQAPLADTSRSASTVPAEVQGDDAGDRFVGTGGLILPSSHPRRTEVAECADCQWRLSTPCVELNVGQAFSGTTTCASVTRGCPDQQLILRIWFRSAGSAWQDLGVVCVGESGPITVRRLGEELRVRMARDLPPLRPAAQPSRGAVTQLPVVFRSGQPGRWAASLMLLGLPVEVVGDPMWSWNFADGATVTTDDPGGRYPDLAVSHVYRRPGEMVVSVAATWAGKFTVDGLGPFGVEGVVEQSARLDVRVGEGRALLTGAPA